MSYQPWATKEIDALCALYPSSGPEATAEALGRNVYSVKNKALELGLSYRRKRQRRMSEEQSQRFAFLVRVTQRGYGWPRDLFRDERTQVRGAGV